MKPISAPAISTRSFIILLPMRQSRAETADTNEQQNTSTETKPPKTAPPIPNTSPVIDKPSKVHFNYATVLPIIHFAVIIYLSNTKKAILMIIFFLHLSSQVHEPVEFK